MKFKAILIVMVMVAAATAVSGQANYQATDSAQPDSSQNYKSSSDTSKASFTVPITIEKSKDGCFLKFQISQSIIDFISGVEKKDSAKEKQDEKQSDNKDAGKEKEQEDKEKEEKENDKQKDGEKDEEKHKEEEDEKADEDKGADRGYSDAKHKGKDRSCYDYKGQHKDMYNNWKDGRLHTVEFRFLTPEGQGPSALEYDNSCGERDDIDDGRSDDESDEGSEESGENESDQHCHYHGEGEDRRQHCPGGDESNDNGSDNNSDDGSGEENSDDQDSSDEDEPEEEQPEDGSEETNEGDGPNEDESDDGSDTVTEERTVTDAPEPSSTGEDWISYPNPRDHYLHPEVHREGSIKVCKILLNQNGEPITGSSIPDTTFTLDTSIGDVVDDAEYEADSGPVTWTTELNQVADVIGTSPDYIEGDGKLDAECAEFHDLPLDQTYTYREETISGANADKVETLGYQEYWEIEQPPYKQAEPYGSSELSDGEVTLTAGDDNRHAEIFVINQLTG